MILSNRYFWEREREQKIERDRERTREREREWERATERASERERSSVSLLTQIKVLLVFELCNFSFSLFPKNFAP